MKQWYALYVFLYSYSLEIKGSWERLNSRKGILILENITLICHSNHIHFVTVDKYIDYVFEFLYVRTYRRQIHGLYFLIHICSNIQRTNTWTMLLNCYMFEQTLHRGIYGVRNDLTHWSRVTHIFVSKLTSIGSDNSLSPVWCQAITWTNAGVLSIGLLGISFCVIWIGILSLSFKKMYFKMPYAKMAAILSRRWVKASKSFQFLDFQWNRYSLVQVMACFRFGARTLPEVMLNFFLNLAMRNKNKNMNQNNEAI